MAVPAPDLARRICRVLDIDPLGAIASGALLLTALPAKAEKIRAVLESEGIACAEIGWVEEGPPEAWQVAQGVRSPLPYPQRDEIARLF